MKVDNAALTGGKTGEDYARHQFSACQLQCHLEVAPVSILTYQLVQCRALSAEGTGGTRQGWAEAVASLPGSSVSEMSPLETQYHSLSSKLHLHPGDGFQLTSAGLPAAPQLWVVTLQCNSVTQWATASPSPRKGHTNLSLGKGACSKLVPPLRILPQP